MTEQAIDVAVKPPREPRHLGDGVYAGYDGWHMTLAIGSHLAHPVAFIDPGVYQQLKQYAKELGWEK